MYISYVTRILPLMSSYKFASINSNTRASLPVGWSYKTSSKVMT